MPTRPFSLLAPLALLLVSLAAAFVAQPQGLVVHEWGTFTSVSGQEGMPLVWRPLSVESDLPPFVYSTDRGASWHSLRYPSKSGGAYRVRMETPVLYFYSREERTVSVSVKLPEGKATEWYPQAGDVGRSTFDGHIFWPRVTVLASGARADFPNDGSNNHYYPARATDASPLRVGEGADAQHEKFLFYRGVGDFTLPLTAGARGGKVHVRASQEVSQVILFENRNGRVGYRFSDVARGETALELPAPGAGLDDLRRDLKALLVARGLYEREAEAMIETWRDSWFEEGLRLFYVMPRKLTDEVLPTAIEPAPAQLVRVMVGRAELISPEMAREVLEQIPKLDDGSEAVRAEAMRQVTRRGRFTETLLGQAYEQTTDARLRARIERLSQELSRGAARPD